MHLHAVSRVVLASRGGANAATVCTLLNEHPEADLAVLPELVLLAYALRGITPVDLDAGGPAARIARSARPHGGHPRHLRALRGRVVKQPG
ncbi:MAG: hypothetical protein M0013_07130 [Actinomycetota bacterium]|nr:hypothetical protein [Actinomycetota bacterium]